MTLKVLYLSALPRDQHPIPVEGEYKAILDARNRSEYRSQILISDWPGVSLREFQSVIETFRPNVLHFSGHATAVGELVFQGPEEESQEVPKDPFTNAFKLLGNSIKLVILSACYSKEQAEDIVHHVDRVIGIDKEIEADKAIMFSEKFYESIGNGQSVEKAFDIAKNQLPLNIQKGESLPDITLLRRESIDLDQLPLFLIETPRKQLTDYLNSVIIEKPVSVRTIDSPLENPLSYIDSRMGMLVSIEDDWDALDSMLEKRDKNNVTDVQDIVDDFLSDSDERIDLVIGGSFGIGKSLFVRRMARDLAKRVVDSGDHDIADYIPILVSDINTIDNYYHGRTIEDLIQNIVAPYDNHKKILIIFDGVDQYKAGTKKLIERVRNEFFRNYDKRKIILTTRLVPEFPEEYGASKTDTYLRLLPFTVPQANQFFQNSEIDLTYQKAVEFGVSDEDTRKPLLAFLISEFYKHNQQDFGRLSEERTLTSYEYRAFIYLHFIHRLLRAKTEQRFVPNEYREEKRILRRITLLMKLFKEKLTESVILDKSSSFMDLFELDAQDPVVKLKGVLHDYFNIQTLDRPTENRILFLHSTFKEYLMAENYVEILLRGEDSILNSSWMNVLIPTVESIQYLEGLLGLIQKRSKSGTIRKWIDKNDDNEGSLFNSFNYDDRINDPLQSLIANCITVIKDDTASLLIRDFDKSSEKRYRFFVSGDLSFNSSSDRYSDGRCKDIDINEYENLWINRWISLLVLNNTIDRSQIPSDKVFREKLVKLILFTGRFMPGYLKKLSRLNLSGADLSGADLSGADLSGADLSGTKLWNTNLWGANLTEAHVSGADFYNSCLYRADLSGANFGKKMVDLVDANLYGANLSNINPLNANFFHTNIDNATVSNTLYKEEMCMNQQHLYRLINTNAGDEEDDDE